MEPFLNKDFYGDALTSCCTETKIQTIIVTTFALSNEQTLYLCTKKE